MSKWQRYTVEIAGAAEPVEVQTNARDWAAVPIETGRAMDSTFRVVHAAMRRQGMDVPVHYDAFLDVLDAMPEVAANGDGPGLDPTQPAP